jgi:hypothetical protein
MAGHRCRQATQVLPLDDVPTLIDRVTLAFLLAVNIAKLPSVPRQTLKDIPRPPNSASRED